MGIYYKKRSDPKKAWGKIKAKDNVDVRACPSCGEWAEPYEVHRDRITYKCKNCKATNTFTVLPSEVNQPEKKVKKLGAITLRDKSKKPKKEKALKLDETPVEDVEEAGLVGAVSTIKQGMKDVKLISFDYVDNKGNVSQRSVEPYKLTVDKNGQVILYGFCTEANGIRVFKIKRAKNCTQLPYEFEPRWPVEDKLLDNE